VRNNRRIVLFVVLCATRLLSTKEKYWSLPQLSHFVAVFLHVLFLDRKSVRNYFWHSVSERPVKAPDLIDPTYTGDRDGPSINVT
jgi:hypothetical protein